MTDGPSPTTEIEPGNHGQTTVVVLGSGTSHGIPMLDCGCPVCTSPDPRDHRNRTCIRVEFGGKRLLIDAPPEMRLQAIQAHIRHVDALFLTHTHADHVFGLDDVRRFSDRLQTGLPIYGTESTLEEIRRIFYYAFVKTQKGGSKPQLDLRPIAYGPLEGLGPGAEAIPVIHGRLPVTAYRFGRFAFVTDASFIPESSLDRLQGLDVLLLGALRWEPHPTHFSIPEALKVVDAVKPRRTFFTHLCHRLPHAETEAQLPPGVRLAYDGLRLTIPA